ncbi:MAG: DUF3349 domain-containing protein, partial [Mycobacterium sp.]
GTDSKAGVRKLLRSTVDWLRAGYPDEAPNTGYSPLIALDGPAPLTPKQKRRTLGEVAQDAASATEISIAITKVTDRLPTPAQTSAIERALQARKLRK